VKNFYFLFFLVHAVKKSLLIKKFVFLFYFYWRTNFVQRQRWKFWHHCITLWISPI